MPMTRKGRILVPATVPFLAQAFQHLWLVVYDDVYRAFTWVRHTIHPRPSPPDAGRYALPSRFRRQSGDCGSIVRRRCTRRYLLAHLRRIPLMGQRGVSWHNAKHNNDSDDFMSQPPVRPVRATFIAHGSRKRELYRRLPFHQLHGLHRGQLTHSLATFVPFSPPSSSGPLPCTRLSRVPTPLPHLTACWALEFRLGFPMPTLHPPCHPLQALPCSRYRTQAEYCRWRVAECPFHALWLPNCYTG